MVDKNIIKLEILIKEYNDIIRYYMCKIIKNKFKKLKKYYYIYTMCFILYLKMLLKKRKY